MPSENDLDLDAPLIIVTADAHVGPRLREDLRQYCPQKYLAEYDEFVHAFDPFSDDRYFTRSLVTQEVSTDPTPAERLFKEKIARNLTCAGHYDVNERLKDMNRDGVAAEVIFHGSQNGQCFPFLNTAGQTFNAMVFTPALSSAYELELAAVGQRMYNQWLADACAVEPERHVGLAHLPMWDIEAATRELEWASDVGLKGLNLPGPKLGIPTYDEPAWDRFWSICEERQISINTHDGAGIDTATEALPHTLLVVDLDELQRKMLPRLILGGVFERHPGLRFLLTELQVPTSRWWTQTANDYDKIWEANRHSYLAALPRKPSEYMRENVFLGNSLLFLAPREVDLALEEGYASQLIWGSDYPHAEGSFLRPEDGDEETMTMKGLRGAFSAAPPAAGKAMVGDTGVDVLGLDREKLLAVADRIGAMTLRQLATPLESIPEVWTFMSEYNTPFEEYHRGLDYYRHLQTV